MAENAICMTARRDWKTHDTLLSDKNTLLRKYPKLGDPHAEPVDFFNEVIRQTFMNGLSKTVFVRNYTLTENSDIIYLGVRLKRMPEDFLTGIMPDDKTLMLRVFVYRDFLTVIGVSVETDENVLPYEVESQIIRYDEIGRVKEAHGGWKFLSKLAKDSAALNVHTHEELTKWLDYIEWRRNIVKARMHGAKYIRVQGKEEKLVFTLQFENEEAYETAFKWLRRDELAVYEESFSDDDGNFAYDENSRKSFQAVGRWNRKSSTAEKEIGGKFIAELAYDLPNTDELDDLTPQEREIYIQTQVLPRYPQTGFLAPLVIKDLALLKREETAINNLLNGKDCRSSNLSMWISDVKLARLPKPQEISKYEREIGNDWLNRSVADNENQRKAILKMLAAPDLCLIQGPPGTGKTTVIAEAIYQFVKQGNRVLLASQSHDAVDNALERLAERSEIRAVRLGERKFINKEDGRTFTEKHILSGYYKYIGKSIKNAFMVPWEENRRQYDELNSELYDWQNVREHRLILDKKRIETGDNLRKAQRELSQANKDLDSATEEIQNHEAAKSQLKNFADMAAHEEIFEELYLPDRFGDILSQCLLPVINFANERGILLLPEVNDLVICREPNLTLRQLSEKCRQLQALCEKLLQACQNAATDSTIAKLKIDELKQKISEITEILADEDDAIRRTDLKKQRERLRDELYDLQAGSCAISDEDLSWFDAGSQKQIQSDSEPVARDVKEILARYKVAVAEAVKLIGERLAKFQSPNFNELKERVAVCNGTIKYLKQELEKLHRDIAENDRLSDNLSKKYGCEYNDIETVIKEKISALEKSWDEDVDFRDVWTDTFDEFISLLEKESTANYDSEYFFGIYLRSCNVVGITCTANMKKLVDNFSDFDVVIIDEVSKATLPELLLPLMKARKTILVGDHRQLPPVFGEQEKSYNELLDELHAETDDTEFALKEEDFKKHKDLVTASLFRKYFEAAHESIKHSLLTQYRMHSDIQKVINRFYDGQLINGLTAADENRLKAHDLKIPRLLNPEQHVCWIDSSTLHGKFMYQNSSEKSTSLYNIFECNLIRCLLLKINDAYAAQGKSGITVGIISFYGLQVGMLLKMVRTLRNAGKLKALNVAVNTVDRFQGKEKQIIITSLVRNARNQNVSNHVRSFERVNVAFSRAQNLLIIVGASKLYGKLTVEIPDMNTGEPRSANIYQNILDELQRKNSFVSGEELLSDREIQTVQQQYEEAKKQ